MLSRVFTLLGSVVPAILLGIVLVIISADVFARTILSQSIPISHDLAIVSLAGVVWFGIVGIAARNELFGVQFFVDRLPGRWKTGVRALVHIIVIAICAEVIHAAIIQVETARFTRFLSLGWPKWIVSAGLALALSAVVVIQIIQLYKLIRGTGDKDTSA